MKTLSRILAPLTLLEWGAILLYFYASDRLADFLHPSFRPLVLVTGVLLLGVALVVALFHEEKCAHDHSAHDHDHGHAAHDHDHEHDGHGHGNLTIGGMLAFLVLCLPLALAAAVSPESFSADLVRSRSAVADPATLPGSAARAQAEEYRNPYLEPNAEGNVRAEVIDLLYAAVDPAIRADFEGKSLEIVGQYLPPAERDGGAEAFQLVRLFMSCCAADVRPLAVEVVSVAESPGVAPMGWVKVVGTLTFESLGGKLTPVVLATAVTPTESPEEQYVY